MKAVWNGSISFGLVSIPVKLYSAIQEHSLGFRLLCAKCHTPITYERRCEKCNKKVAWSDVVKGLKIEKDTYFILTKEKLHALKPITTDTIDIVEFVDKKLLVPLYYEHHYYIAPSKKGEKAYFLFKQALEKSGKVAIGRFVMREKEYVCALDPYQTGMVLSTLNYAYEIRDMAKLEELEKVPTISAAELKLAQELINKWTKKKFDISAFKDTFAQKLMTLIKQSGKKKKQIIIPKVKEVPAKREKDLLTTLRASLRKKPTVSRQPGAYAKGGR